MQYDWCTGGFYDLKVVQYLQLYTSCSLHTNLTVFELEKYQR